MKRVDPWLAVTLAVGAGLLLSSLGNGRLWEDEAETAVLGKNILRFGYPRAFDGVNRLNPSLPVREGYAWEYHSWLPMYLAAGAFWLFGADTAPARLPFALLGLGAVALAFHLIRRLTGEQALARWTGVLLVSSVPFLLHMRQCRYYAPALFFTLWAVLAYWHFLERRRFSGAEWIAALLLLFHSDHGVFLPVALAMGLHFLFSRPDRADGHRFLTVGVVVLALTVPWIVYLEALQHQGVFSFQRVSHHLQFYFRQINRFILPVIFWGALTFFWRSPFRGLFGTKGSSSGQGWGLIGCLLGAGFLFLIFIPDQRHFRYLIFLLPFLLAIQAACLNRLFKAHAALGLAVGGLLLLTDLIHYPKVRIRSLPIEFISELTHPYRGPVDGIVEHLLIHAKPGESVKATPAEDHPLLFYTSLRVEPMDKVEEFSRETFPDWIVIRRDWLPGGFFESPYYRQIQARYREVLLDAPDIPWQNRPDPGYHRFRTDKNAPPVVIFQRRS